MHIAAQGRFNITWQYAVTKDCTFFSRVDTVAETLDRNTFNQTSSPVQNLELVIVTLCRQDY